MECGFPLPPSAPYKGAEGGHGRPARPIEAEEGQATGADPLPRPASARFPASTAATPSAWRPRGRRTEPRRRVRRPLPTRDRGEWTPRKPHLDPIRLPNHASTSPPIYGGSTNHPLYRDVTHACGPQPRARYPRHARLACLAPTTPR